MANSPWSPSLREKIAKLIRMLSSVNDMETLSAARAIVRELNNEGADIHNLADLVLNSSAAPSHSTTFSEKRAASSAPGQWSRNHLVRNRSLVSCSICIHHMDQLTPSELQYIRSIEPRLKDEARPYTRAEIERLDAICRRFERRDAY
jgi:hypothetical protein